jgi:hypothetical protein
MPAIAASVASLDQHNMETREMFAPEATRILSFPAAARPQSTRKIALTRIYRLASKSG